MNGVLTSRSAWPRQVTVALLIPALLVSGCATTRPTSPTATQDQKRLEQLSEAYNETLAEGCLVGAGLGAGIGAAANSRDRALGALIGAGIGTIVGCAAGSYMGNLQNSYATEEDRLDAVVADLQRDNQALSNMIPVARNVVADNRARIDELNAAVAKGRMSRAQAAEQLDDLDATRGQLQSTLTSARKRLADQRQAVAQNSSNADPQRVAVANAEIRKKEQQIAALEAELGELTKLRSVSRVG